MSNKASRRLLRMGWILLAVLLCLSLVAVTACGTATPSQQQEEEEEEEPLEAIKIGMIRPLTGHMAITGARMVAAAEFALEEAGYTVAGRQIEVIVEDSAADPPTAVDAAIKLITQDEVDLIIGPTTGGCQMAVSAYMNGVGKPLIFTNPAPLGVLFEGHEWTFMVGGTEWQTSSPIGVFAGDDLGHGTATTIAGDWAPGHGFMDGFQHGFESEGGVIIQQQWPPQTAADFGSYLASLEPADTVVAWFDGSTSIQFLTQFHEFGVRQNMPLLACFHGSFFAPFILELLPEAAGEAVVGEFCPTPYTPLLDTAINNAFVDAWGAATGGELPEDTDTGPYAGVLVALAALEATDGDTTPELLRDAILAVNLEGPEGPILFDQGTHVALKTIYVCEVTKNGEVFVWEPVKTYENVPPFGYGFGGPP